MTVIRRATAEDAPAICSVVNPVIRDTLITFTTTQRTPDDIIAALALSTPFWVAETDGEITGYASYAPFRAGPGYVHTMEHSIALTDRAQGQGTGRALMGRLLDHAANGAVHSMIAGVSAPNTRALTFHKSLGFEQVGHIRDAGYKFGQWIDLILLQKRLLLPCTTG